MPARYAWETWRISTLSRICLWGLLIIEQVKQHRTVASMTQLCVAGSLAQIVDALDPQAPGRLQVGLHEVGFDWAWHVAATDYPVDNCAGEGEAGQGVYQLLAT